MATAWRHPTDLLQQYLNDNNEDPPHDATIDQDQNNDDDCYDEEEEDTTTPPSTTPPWYHTLRGRLARQGILLLLPPPLPPPPSPHSSVPPLNPTFIKALEQYQTQLRGCLRLLQGALALRCGRGVSVPMVPLTQWEKDGEEENEEEMQEAIHTYVLALPSLRRMLLQSLRRVSSSLAVAVGGIGQSSLLAAPATKATTSTHTNLLELQLAFQEWCLFVGEALPQLLLAEKEEEDLELLRGVLEEECLCLSAAFDLEGSRRREGEEDEQEQEPPPSSETTHTQTHTRHLKHKLQGLGHRLAMERAKVESRLARVFLQQCAVADLLAAVEVEAQKEEEEEGGDVKESRINDQYLYKELEGLRERMAGAQEAELVVIEEMMACLVRPGGGEKEEEGGGEAKEKEEEVVVEGGGGNEDAVGKERQVKKETQNEYETPGKENETKEKEEEVEEVVLEVFEGLSSSSSSSSVPTHRGARATAAAAAATATQHQHDALMGELGHLLTGRRKQQQHQQRQVKVNGALVALRDEEELEEEEERVVVAGGDKAREGPSSPVEMDIGMGSSLLAALLQQENRRREKEEEEGSVLIFDGEGEGEEEREE